VTLATLVQDDFSAGSFPLFARDEVPLNGFENGLNVLVSDDGLPERRGGTAYLSTSAGLTSGFNLLWNGILPVGERTLFADSSDFGTLDGAGAPVNLGGSGVIVPSRAVETGGIVYVDGGTIWAGSRKTANYSTGTVSVTNGSTTVTGAGTAWLANLDAGMLVKVAGGRYYVVASVTDDTHFELTSAYQGSTAGGQAYTATVLGTAPKVAPVYAVGVNRLVACIGNRAYMSQVTPTPDPQTFATTEYQELPNGVQILAATFLRDTLFLFTNVGVWTVTGVALNLTDALGNPQQRLEQTYRDLIVWGAAISGVGTVGNTGLAAWGNGLIVPTSDGVYLLDGYSQPAEITGGMLRQYREYVRLGFLPGQATVYRGHYCLPIAGGSPVLLMARLVPTRRGRGIAWTTQQDNGGAMSAVVVRPSLAGETPQLIGAGADRRIHTLRYFDLAQFPSDANGTAHVAEFVTRELTGDISTLIKKLRIRYELTDPSTVNPTLSAEWAQADGGYTALTGTAGETTKPSTKAWPVSQRNAHFRLRTSGATSKFMLHSITTFIRPSGRQ
jgi:hypothetical protein